MTKWVLPNIAVSDLFKQVEMFKHREGREPFVFYRGKVRHDDVEYDFPGSLEVNDASVDDKAIQLIVLVEDEELGWWVEIVEPYTFELVDSEEHLSVKPYEITLEEFPELVKYLSDEDLSYVEELIEVNDEDILDPLPSIDEYVRGFRVIESKMPDSHRDLLVEHYRAPGLTITATNLAKAVGYKNFRGVNLQYGKLGKRLREALRYDGGGQDSYILSYFIPPGVRGNTDWLFIMHGEVASALEILGWVNPMWRQS